MSFHMHNLNSVKLVFLGSLLLERVLAIRLDTRFLMIVSCTLRLR
jgi:hypothetical protein